MQDHLMCIDLVAWHLSEEKNFYLHSVREKLVDNPCQIQIHSFQIGHRYYFSVGYLCVRFCNRRLDQVNLGALDLMQEFI